MRKMNKTQVVNQFKEFILPELKRMYESDGIVDIPARREAFNNYTDSLCKNGEISERLYNSICIPKSLLK